MTQAYSSYTDHDHRVWRLLFERQSDHLQVFASKVYLDGLGKIGFRAGYIPDFERETSPILRKLTGWQVEVVKGLVTEPDFFALIKQKRFPSSRWLRTMKQLDYLEEPDMFHDTFGHLPLLTNPDFCAFLSRLADIAMLHLKNPATIELIRRLYWFTAEFGLIHEGNEVKAYGAGLISSIGECAYAIQSNVPERFDFDLETVLNTEVKIDEYQKQYFVVNSFEQLLQSLDDFSHVLEERTQVSVS